MPDLAAAIRVLADHLFRDQSAESQAKRQEVESHLSSQPEPTPEEVLAGESAVPDPSPEEESQPAPETIPPDAAGSADAPVNPQVLDDPQA